MVSTLRGTSMKTSVRDCSCVGAYVVFFVCIMPLCCHSQCVTERCSREILQDSAKVCILIIKPYRVSKHIDNVADMRHILSIRYYYNVIM